MRGPRKDSITLTDFRLEANEKLVQFSTISGICNTTLIVLSLPHPLLLSSRTLDIVSDFIECSSSTHFRRIALGTQRSNVRYSFNV